MFYNLPIGIHSNLILFNLDNEQSDKYKTQTIPTRISLLSSETSGVLFDQGPRNETRTMNLEKDWIVSLPSFFI